MRACCCRPKITMLFFCGLLLLIVCAIIAIVVTQTAIPKSLQMMWQAPAAYRGGQVAANNIDMNAELPERVRFQMRGAVPFSGNFIVYYDFKTGKSVIVDESLKKNGEQFACFVMPINTANTPNYEAMVKAASRAKSRIGQSEGWDEDWSYAPSPADAATTKAQFNPPIPECNNARWIQLQKAVGDQRNQKCTECHDFCLPEFGIQGDANEGYLNIVRRDCVHLFVPEWRSYAQTNTPEQNQRDFEAFYRNKQQGGQNGDGSGSKWIPLAGMRPPQPFGPSSPSSIPAPGGMPMNGQQMNGNGQQQLNGNGNGNGYGLPMQPYGVGQQQQGQMPMNGQQQPGSFQPYGVVQQGVQPQQQQGILTNGMGSSNGNNGLFPNGVAGIPQQVANAGQNAINTIGNAVSDVGQGVSNLYGSLQNAGSQAVDQFGNAINNAQQSISGVVNTPQSGGTGSSIGVGGYGQRLLGYGSGGVVGNTNGGSSVDWNGSQQSRQQTTYPGGFMPNNGLQSTGLEAGVPGVNNPQYYQNGQQQQQQRMGDLTGYAPNVVSTANGGLQQMGADATDPRQMTGVIGMAPSSTNGGQQPPVASGYVPDVAPVSPQQQQQLNQFYGRGR